MAIFAEYSNYGVTSSKNISLQPQYGRHFENVQVLDNSFNLTSEINRSSQIMQEKFSWCYSFIVMTSSMTSQGDLKVVSPNCFMNEKITFFMITEQRTKISSLNSVYIYNTDWWIRINKLLWIALLMTSSSLKICHNCELQYLCQYLSKGIGEKLKMSLILMVIFPVSLWVKNFLATSKWRPFWKCQIIKYSFIWPQNLTDHPKLYKKNISMVMTSSMTSQGDLNVVSLFLYGWKNNIFRDNPRTNKDIIFKLSIHKYHRIVNTPLQTVMDCFIDDVIGSQNMSKFELQ